MKIDQYNAISITSAKQNQSDTLQMDFNRRSWRGKNIYFVALTLIAST